MEISDTLNSKDIVPSLIDASSLVSRRINQISDLVDVIRNGGRDYNPKTAAQRLPRHMRRRAMSHNIKRLPRKNREFAQSLVAKTSHRKKAPSRFHKRRPKNLQKEYAKRSNTGPRWLQTHIWHAKRFEMIKLWGYKLPLRCYQRGVRPFMKTARDDVVMFDDSYFRMLRIRFSSSDQLASYKQRYFELRNESCCSLNGLRVSGSGIQQLFLMDRENDVHDVMLSAHPLFYEKPLELFSELCGSSFRVLSTEEMQVKLKEEYGNDLPLVVYEGNNCLVTDESNLYSVFSMYGSKVIPNLFRRLSLVNDQKDFENIHTNWTKFCQSGGGINDLPNGSAFTLLVEDPRLSSILTSSSENPTTPVTKQRIQPPSERSNLLFDRKGVRKCLSSAITEAKLNELKSTRVGTIKLKHYKIPVILSFWNWCSTNHFKLILPAETARTFFSYFYRCGFRVGALSDRFVLCNELADCAYPFALLPLTIDRTLYRWKRYCKFKDVVLEGFGRWNNLRENWSHVVDNPNQLAYLQSILNSSQIKQNDINVDNALVPVHVVVLGKGPIKDDNLIYEWTKTQVADIEMGEACDYDPHKFFDSDSDTPMETNEKPTIHFKRKIRQPKLHEDDGMIIGRLVFAEQSFYRGSSEALGYVDLKCFEKLCTSRGKVRLRNPFGTKFVTAQVKILYSR